jgi:tRNA threonylcarbamoyladenosine biosynthesis protein TsaB
VRIGLATARALGFAAAKPVRGITTLALMAQKATPNWRRFVCALPAGREQVYVQGFGEQPAFPEACMASIAEIATLAAEGMPCVITEQPWIEALPAQSERLFHDTTENAYLACQWAWHTPQDTSCAPLPLYIRPPDAKPQAPLF